MEGIIELKDLGVLVEETRKNLADFKHQELFLSAAFKKAFKDCISGSGNSVVFEKTTAVITNASGQKIYAPNQWFVLASLAVPLAREVMTYRKFTESFLEKRLDEIKALEPKTIKEKKDVYQLMRAGEEKEPVLSMVGSHLSAIFTEELMLAGYEDKLARRNSDFLVRFMKDSKWWLGGKGIERTNDYYVSPILGVLNLVNASQSYVATMTFLYINDSKLSAVIDDMVRTAEDIDPDDADAEYDDEYQRAAQIIKDYVTETGFTIPEDKASIKQALSAFDSRFNPAALQSVSDDKLLQTIFYTSGDNSDALCYWLEAKKEYRSLFGSIAGGSAFKFALFQKKETGNWTTGSPQKPQELSDEEALELGKQIRDKLVAGAMLIQQAELHSVADYEKLDADIRSTIGDQLYNLTWVHKYFAMVCPDKLSGFHSADWQCHALRCLKVRPSDKYYVRSGQLSMIENYAGMYYREFFSVMYDKFGGVKQFFRLGTSDGTNNYAPAWKQRSVIGLGWKDLGTLTEYVSGDGLDRGSVADKLSELYYSGDTRTSSRKAGEIVRFYKTDADSILVAMDGEKLIAFIDEIGEYFYDPSGEMAHMKSGKWHCNFVAGDVLPAKAEGKLTSCYQLSDEDNLMFLYEKYYYGTEEADQEEPEDETAADAATEDTIMDDEDTDAEDRNKRLFRYWMTTQVKPEGDSDAGQPYSKTSVDQYVSNVANTPLHGNPSKSVFYTVQIGQVQATIDELDNMERKNHNQRSAVRKYMQFLTAMKEGSMPLNYRTELESNHERNRIVFGAPGTGKSYALKHDTEEFLKGTSGTMERVTFHPDYTYSQFVGTYKPVSDAGTIKYEFVPGPFMRVFVDAVKSGMTEDPQPHVLVIEEINRAKVAAVFGDVFQLLDRDDDGVSEYDIQTSEDIRKYLAKELGGKPSNYSRIRIPNNMFIWATMNSADQGVFPMDTAFKRRWNFEYLGINQNEGEIRGKVMLGTDVVQEDVSWNALRRAINEKLAKEYKVNEDKLMGPFFLSKKVIKTISDTDDTILDTDRFIETFKSKVIMYLYEDAAKQHKHKLFSGCEDTTKYSAVCDSFERIGMQIFGEDFEEVYYKPQEEAQEG